MPNPSSGPPSRETPEHESADASSRTSLDGSISGIKFAGLGLELAIATLLLGGVGYWWDQSRGHGLPYAGIAGVFAGFCLGMYRLIATATRGS